MRAAILTCVIAWSALATTARADVRHADAFSDHMVLQRGKPTPVWGTAAPGERVEVSFAGQSKSARADGAGRWLVRLDPLEASREARDLVLRGATTEVTIRDVLVGDVWIAGGQSNMGRQVRASWRPEGFSLDWPLIRFLKVDSPGSSYPVDGLAPPLSPPRGPELAVGNRWNVCRGDVTTQCSAVGFFFAQRVLEETGVPQGLLWNAWGGSVAREWIPALGWRRVPELAATAREVESWYPETEIGRAAHLEALDAIDAWIAKAETALERGEPFPYPQPTLPRPPDQGNGRGTTFLYNGRLHPLVPFAIAGILWYQGESDYANGDYRYQIEAMVEAWRRLFAGPGESPADLPFYFVQMQRCGTYMSPGVRDKQLQSFFTIPNAGMAVLMDLDVQLHPWNKFDAGRRLARWALAKRYGREIPFSGPIYRSRRVAGRELIVEFDHAAGGLFIGRKNELEPVERLPAGKLVNVETTADGRRWVPAEARIAGETLVVWADEVDSPTDARYCWKSIAEEPFLYNDAGLPAAQFNSWTLQEELDEEQRR